MKPTAVEPHRLGPRLPVSQPIDDDEAEPACAGNFSEQGICFVSPVLLDVGATIEVTVESTRGGLRHKLRFEGEVLRIEPGTDGNGVAARLRTPFFAGEEFVVPAAD